MERTLPSFPFARSQGPSKRLITGIPNHSRKDTLHKLLIKMAKAGPKRSVCGQRNKVSSMTVG